MHLVAHSAFVAEDARAPAASHAAELMRRLFYTGLGLCAWAVVDDSACRLIQLGAFTSEMQSVLDDKLHDEKKALAKYAVSLHSAPVFPLMLAAQEARALIDAMPERAHGEAAAKEARRL